MSDKYIFRVQVLEGKGFGEDPQTLLCSAQFAGEVKTTQYSVSTDAHIWNSTLTWGVGREELRKAQASGSSHCKITVLRKDGTRLGWVVVSLRSAKLQSLYRSDPQGQWLQLNASKLVEPPQLRVSYALCEERLLMQLDQPTAAASPVTTGPSNSSGAKSSNSSQSLRRHSSSSAAASLRPSKSLSIRKQLSANDVSSSEVQKPTDSEGAAAPGTVAVADAKHASLAHESTTAAAPTPTAAISTAEPRAGTPGDEASLQQQEGMLEEQQGKPTAVAVAPDQPNDASADQAESTSSVLTGVVPGAGAATTQAMQTAKADVAATSPMQANPVSHSVTREQSREALVAAAEASLPSFAARKQQQQLAQLQLAKQRLEQEHLQMVQQQTAAAQPQQQVQPSDQPQLSDMQQILDLVTGSTLGNSQTDTAALQRLQPPADTARGMNEIETQVPADAATTAVPTSTPATAEAAAVAEVSAVDDTPALLTDPVRQFAFTLDVRSFQAGRRLPLALASAYVTAFLPQEFVAFLTTTCGAKIPPKLTPLRTIPAVDVLRGSEGGLPHGCASVSFTAGVVGLAGLLAQEPRVVLEVWHKEKLRSDVLLGVASVSLSALLQECWVDGYAPVYALMTKAAADQEVEEKVQVGMLRVVLSLEDQGPPAAAAPLPAGISSKHLRHSTSSLQSPHTTPSKVTRQLTPPKHQPPASGLGKAPADLSAGVRPYAQKQRQLQQGLVGQADAVQDKDTLSKDAAGGGNSSHMPLTIRADSSASEGVAPLAGGAKQMPELMAAWELEVWKKAEEARFRAQLQELEQQRMSVIEAQWWKRERARESEIAAMKTEYARLEQQTKALLAAVQERESKLVAAEADLRRRQSDMERQQAARMSEAEAAVRRLQVECEHQLSLERDRTAAVARQRDAAEARLLAAEARAAAMEAQFAEYRAAQRATPEAQLQLQLQQAQTVAAAAEARAAKAVKAKKHYKEQVLQLARELAAVHQQRQQEQVLLQKKQQEAAKAKVQSSAAVAQAVELADLREQLTALRMAAMAAAAAETTSRSRSPSSSELSYKQQQQQQHQRQHRRQRTRHMGNKENAGRHEQQQWSQHKGGKSQLQEQFHAHDLGVGVSSDDEQQWHDHEQHNSDNSDEDSSNRDHAASSDEDDDRVSHQVHHRQQTRLQQLKRHQQQRHQRQQATAAGLDAAGAAADAALAEVAALAAMLNQPQPASAQAAVQQDNLADADKQQVQQHSQVLPAAPADTQGAVVSDKSSQLQQQPAERMQAAASNAKQQQQQQQHMSSVDSITEVRRLLKEKVELLSSGLYNKDDAVILQIDARVQELAEQQVVG